MYIGIAYISVFSLLIPLSLAIVHWNKIVYDVAALRWLLVAGLISDAAQRIMAAFVLNNLWVGILFMFIQFTVLLYIFSLQFEHRIIFKITYALVVILYTIILIHGHDAAWSLVRSNVIDGLVLIIVSIVFFYKLLNELKVINILRLPVLWIAFATLFYYSGNFFVFLARSYLEYDKDTFIAFWMLHNALNITKNILFAVALWQSYRTMKSLI